MAYKSYPFYVITPSGKIASGWEYREDAKDFVRENPGHGLKIVTKATAKRAGHSTWTTNSNPFGAARNWPPRSSAAKRRAVAELKKVIRPMNRCATLVGRGITDKRFASTVKKMIPKLKRDGLPPSVLSYFKACARALTPRR